MIFQRPKAVFPEHIEIDAKGMKVQIRLRPNLRAKRYLLRIPADHSEPVLTIPKGGSVKKAQWFAEKHAGWILTRLQDKPDHVAIEAGAIIPLRGLDHLVVSIDKLRGLVEVYPGVNGMPEIRVPGERAHIRRKMTTWLKTQAKADLTRAAEKHANRINAQITGISIRDTRSRWGSCSSNGALSFSWRLIFAPPEILDYVAAHEVAHLQEMNHSARFWQLCTQLAPQTPKARVWLKEHGRQLHAYR